MPGDSLDLSNLAPGENYGGPAPERGVQLAAALGTGDMREQLSLASLLPNCVPQAPTAATCGAAGLTGWSQYAPATEQAAAEATALGVKIEVQFGQENAGDEALVTSGYWQQDVVAIAEHFALSAPDLAFVEAWNEPNSGPFSPTSYVATVLKPFYEAIQTANAADWTAVQVIGGTIVGMDVSGWWTGIAMAGGFSDMNIAGIHPYPGYDRSFEEEGTPAAIEQLKSLMAGYGVGSMPIWDTEQGWWSAGEESFYDVGNWAPREWMWLKALGVSSWNYFITEGKFNGLGSDFSLIDAANGDYFVKPGAIGLMTVSNLVAGRPFLRQVDLGIPHTYGMLFGPASGSGTDILAVWSDDLAVPAAVTYSVAGSITLPTTGSLGQPGSFVVSSSSAAPFELSGAPLYLTIPGADVGDVSVVAAETFGSNLALASKGATATASSSQGGSNVPSAVIQGTANAKNAGGLNGTPAWASQQGDNSPWVQVNLASAITLDRVVVSTSSLGSVLPGLRDYTVELDENGTWTTVATVTNEFFNRMEEVRFPPAQGVTAIRVVPTAFDLNSAVGGLAPAAWNSTFPDYAVVYSVEAYAPGAVMAPTPQAAATTTAATTAGPLPGANPTTSSRVSPIAPTADLPSGTTPPTVGSAASMGAPSSTRSATPAAVRMTGPAPRVPQFTSAKRARLGLAKIVRHAIEFPRTLKRGRTLPVAVRLTGRRGLPTGQVVVELQGVVLCRSSLKKGASVCRAAPSGMAHSGRKLLQLRAPAGQYRFDVIYQGSRVYAASIWTIRVRIVATVATPPRGP